MNDRILPKVKEEDKQYIIDLYKQIKRRRSLDELLFFKTLVWSCIMAQYENDRIGGMVWLTPNLTFIPHPNKPNNTFLLKPPLGTIEAIDKEYESYKLIKDRYSYFDKNIRNNFGSLI